MTESGICLFSATRFAIENVSFVLAAVVDEVLVSVLVSEQEQKNEHETTITNDNNCFFISVGFSFK